MWAQPYWQTSYTQSECRGLEKDMAGYGKRLGHCLSMLIKIHHTILENTKKGKVISELYFHDTYRQVEK